MATPAVEFHAAARSDVGLVRSNNQDSGYAGTNLLVLADGMGGPAGGDIASSVALAHLVPLLDKEDNWQQRLSPGEQQRIAFARVLLARPAAVLLDEATSALDEPTEAHLYTTLRRSLPESIIVSIGHRNTLEAFHNLSLYVGGGCEDEPSPEAV